MKHYITNAKPSQFERETTINIIMNDNNEWIADIYTNIHKYYTKCIRQGWEQTSETIHKDGSWVSATFRAPAKAISIGKANRPKHQMSEEQRKAASERMAKWRDSKNNNNIEGD